MKPQQKGLMIAAPSSGSGKTVVTLVLLRALKMRGMEVRAAKVGPDYIDPAFHQVACGTGSVNLDPWAMTPNRCRQLANGQNGSHLLVESMMGIFDGAADGTGSGAALAKTLGIPVLLVIDAAKQSHSIGALVRGFRDHDPDLNVCGVILNKIGSARHEMMLRQALAQIAMPVVGVIARSQKLLIPERHLGLVQAGELPEIENFVGEATCEIAKCIDMDLLIECFSATSDKSKSTVPVIPPPGSNIHVARDAAFSFIYPHLLKDWREQGAQISFFSPLADEGPGQNADAVYLPGGYPELHAGKISSADNFFRLMSAARESGALIYGECGGYMVLGEGLIDGEGKAHRMLGMLDLETSFLKRKLHLGYRVAQASSGFFTGQNIFAHEFHYTSAVKEKGEALFTISDAMGKNMGKTGLQKDNVAGSYLHMIDVKDA